MIGGLMITCFFVWIRIFRIAGFFGSKFIYFF